MPSLKAGIKRHRMPGQKGVFATVTANNPGACWGARCRSRHNLEGTKPFRGGPERVRRKWWNGRRMTHNRRVMRLVFRLAA